MMPYFIKCKTIESSNLFKQIKWFKTPFYIHKKIPKMTITYLQKNSRPIEINFKSLVLIIWWTK